MEILALTLAQAAADAARQQALARGAALMLVVVGLGVAVFTGLILYAILRRRRNKYPDDTPEPSAHLDAWGAAADRVQYERRADQYEDDDDDDADDSTWYDDGPDDDDSFGPSNPPGGPPPSGPGPPGIDDDDSFAGDDIPGKRLDF